MKGTRNVKIVYGFGANVAFIMALLFATAWAAYHTRELAGVRPHARKPVIPASLPAPAAPATGHHLVTFKGTSIVIPHKAG